MIMALYAKDCVICLKSDVPRVLRVRFQNRDAPANRASYPYRIAGLSRYIAAAFITICLLVAGVAQAGAAREILVLNSYHPTYEWTKLVMDGIESTLQQYEDRIALDVEYMDTKYFYDERNYENLYALYKYKASRKQYDIIITSDNNALLFILQHRGKLYPNVPVVFCGVDRFHGSILESQPGTFDIDSALQGHDDVTGVIESLDHESTIEIALKLHPPAKRVIIVHDGISETMYWPRLSEEDLTGLIQRFGGRVEFICLLLTEPTFDSLLKKIEGPAGESIVYFADTFRSLGADLHFSKDELEKLRQRCTAPIYVLTERWFGYELIVGGKINSGFHQGQAAAEMAMRILNGESAREIPILRQGPTRYMFDYIQMKRFGISLSDLPEGSIVINEPESFYYLYKKRIWTVITLVAGLAAIVVVLSANILRRKKAEEALRESESKLGAMLESIGDHMSMLDKELNIIWANKTAQKIFGNNIIGKKCYEVYHKRKEPCDPHPCPALKAFQDGKIHEHDTQVIDKNGERIHFHCSTNVALRDKEGNPTAVIEICKDITERKKAAEALRERTLELGKRVKEQNCLYDMAEILDTPDILLDDILQKTAAIIPPAFQYPEITSVRVILKGQEFRTENFRETSWKQSSDIIVSGEQIGSVEVCYLEEKPQMDDGPFLKEEISLLDAIAERLRRVIERREAEEKVLDYQAQLKSLASELSLAEERERHRIATELHDRISQSIVISKVKLEELRESTSSADLAKSIGEICNWLDETIQNTRLLTSDLSSPILYELGFEAAVSEWLAEQIQEKHGIATEFEDDGQPKPLDDDIRALLFRMVQELLINVVKHAQAHKVKVFSRKVDSEVHVSVEDDGVGFNPTETASMPTKTGGFGLFSIRERLEQLGGRLEIESEPGHGCRITVMAPLKAQTRKD